MATVLATVDFSDVTDRVIEEAVSALSSPQDQLCILHVVPPEPDFVGYDAGPGVVRDQVAGEIRGAHRELEDMCSTLWKDGIQATYRFARGPTVETILAVAKKVHADRIVIGSHRYSTVQRWVLGSVSEGVVRKSEVPITVVPPIASPAS